jgi:hypothetical protein
MHRGAQRSRNSEDVRHAQTTIPCPPQNKRPHMDMKTSLLLRFNLLAFVEGVQQLRGNGEFGADCRCRGMACIKHVQLTLVVRGHHCGPLAGRVPKRAAQRSCRIGREQGLACLRRSRSTSAAHEISTKQDHFSSQHVG